MKLIIVFLTFFLSFNIFGICLDTEHIENAVCVPNTKDVPCDTNNANPENSEDVIVDVTINWVNDTWEPTPLCDFTCLTDFHLNVDICEANTKDISCDTNNANPENSEDIIVDVTINWVNDAWEATPLCDFTCLTDFHLNVDICEADIKQVPCDIDNANPENSEDIIVDVDLTWDGTNYSNPELCAWQCITGYHEDNGACVVDDACANVTCGNNEVCESGTCVCQQNFHLENDICESDTKNIDCDIDNNNPANSSDIIAQVEITWNGSDYSAPALCAWTCDSGYHKNTEGTLCEEDVVDLCESVTCGDHSTCNPNNGNCDCNSGYMKENSSCVEIPEETDYERLIKLIKFTGGEYTTLPVMLNELLIGIKIENTSTNEDIVELTWDAKNDENIEKLSLSKGTAVVLKLEYEGSTLGFAENFEVAGSFLLDENGENYMIESANFKMQLVGTIAGIDEDGNPFINRDERNLYSYIRVDLDKDGIYDIKLKIPDNIIGINEVKYDLINEVILYDGKTIDNYDVIEEPIIDNPEEPDSLNCSYSNNNNKKISFLFIIILIIYTKSRKQLTSQKKSIIIKK